MNHETLIKILERKIKDQKFISLIYAMLKSKNQEMGGPIEISQLGSPQGSILSPVLSNVLLHELDKFIEDYIQNFTKGKNRKANPEYMKAYYEHGIKRARRYGQSSPIYPNFRRMSYVRYADDFIITIIGTKAEAILIKQKVAEFLNTIQLLLSDSKTKITNPKDEPVSFLGYQISKTAPIVKTYFRKYAGKMRRISRMTSGSIFLKADSLKVRKRLASKGFCDEEGNPKPNFKYMPNTQHATIIQVNYILRGLASYYKLANNSRQMISKWNYIIRFSTAMMFAAKYRTGSIAKIFTRAGRDLGNPIKKDSLRTGKQIMGQTEEKIYDYLISIGIPKRKAEGAKRVGIAFTKYRDIPKPDIAPLAKNFGITCHEAVMDNPKARKADPLRSLS